MLHLAKDHGVKIIEFFSNAPMWFMTMEKSSAGGQLDPNFKKEFAEYAASAVHNAIRNWSIPVYSVELFNEPSAYWWRFGETGQEGCTISRSDQAELLRLLRTEVLARNLTTLISASDENGLNTAVVSFLVLRNELDQANVHSYYGLSPWRKNRTRRILRALVTKDLWMSEYGDGDGSGETLAQTIFEDLNFLHPSAWIYWQVVEANNDWGMLNAYFAGDDAKDSASRGSFTKITRKHFVFAHFSRFIRNGYLIYPTTDRDTIAAYDASTSTLNIVFKTDEDPHTITFDISSSFHVLNATATVVLTNFVAERLPEVERARLLVHSHCVDRTILRVDAEPDTIVFTGGITNESFASTITNKKVVDTYRHGKVFFLSLNSAPHIVLHLGMTGSLRVKGQEGLKYMDFKTDGEEWPPRFTKFTLVFDDGCEIAFTDPRRLAKVRLVNEPLKEPPISTLGFDPVHAMPDFETFKELIMKRNMPIKALLLDQGFSAGIGNWVADEVLYHAKVHPAQNTQTLLDDEFKSLHNSIQHVINEAVSVNADSDKFPESWLFHYRYGPRQLPASKKSSETGLLFCDFRFSPFSLRKRKGYVRESQETENAILLQQALSPAVRLQKYPKSEIDVFINVLQADGMISTLSLAISCASLALADAGIEMFDTVVACSAGYFESPSKSLQDRSLALDCTESEEEFQIGSLVVAYMPSMREVTHIIHSGEIGVSSLTEALDLCVDGCSKMHDALRQTLLESLKDIKPQ
ncbi:hypothetical protein HDU97_004050 [Phlyctochytrium planicorne]|nr:hypothetical protein HDU97_004050 [Phlyctochytrium planicorne]